MPAGHVAGFFSLWYEWKIASTTPSPMALALSEIVSQYPLSHCGSMSPTFTPAPILSRAIEHADDVKARDRLAYKHHNKANLIRKMALGPPKGTRETARAHRQKAQDWKAPEIAERTT